MSKCSVDYHSFVYVDRSNEPSEGAFQEYYVCIECGEQQVIAYEMGKVHQL